jgi:hypothetical protein
VVERNFNGAGNYIEPLNKMVFKRFKEQSMLFWKYNLGLYDFSNADKTFLAILDKGRPGPPEMIGGHEPTGFYAMGVKNHSRAKAVLLPINLGRIYYLLGYEEHKNILLDVIDYVFPDAGKLIQANTHESVEVILQNYTLNIPENLNKREPDGAILHMINLSGFSGNTYFDPVPIDNLDFSVRLGFEPVALYAMKSEKGISFTYEDGYLLFRLDHLNEFEGIVMKR